MSTERDNLMADIIVGSLRKPTVSNSQAAAIADYLIKKGYTKQSYTQGSSDSKEMDDYSGTIKHFKEGNSPDYDGIKHFRDY